MQNIDSQSLESNVSYNGVQNWIERPWAKLHVVGMTSIACG